MEYTIQDLPQEMITCEIKKHLNFVEYQCLLNALYGQDLSDKLLDPYYTRMAVDSGLAPYLLSCNKLHQTVAMRYAAAQGKLDLIKTLRANGCSWTDKAVVAAAMMNQTHVIEYALITEQLATRDADLLRQMIDQYITSDIKSDTFPILLFRLIRDSVNDDRVDILRTIVKCHAYFGLDIQLDDLVVLDTERPESGYQTVGYSIFYRGDVITSLFEWVYDEEDFDEIRETFWNWEFQSKESFEMNTRSWTRYKIK
jgi:hypothetical protein